MVPPLGGDLRDRAGAVGNDGRLGKQAPDARRRASVALRSRNVNLENFHSLSTSFYLEIDECLADTSPNFGEIVRKIAHSE